MEAWHCCLLHRWLSLTHLDGGWHYCLLHMVVVVPNSPWWRPDTAVCYTGGCPWLTLMEAWHCCLLHRWLSLTHLDGGLALLFVTHGCGCPWLTLMDAWHCCLLHTWLWLSLTHLDGCLTLLFVTHMVVVVPDTGTHQSREPQSAGSVAVTGGEDTQTRALCKINRGRRLFIPEIKT